MSRGRFIWHDLMTTDAEKAKSFYGALLGWTTRSQPAPAGAEYHIVHTGHTDTGGIMPMEAGQGMPSHWMPYVSVDDIEAACEKVKALGGTVVNGPIAIPNTGHFAVIGDDQGAYLSLMSMEREAALRDGRPRDSEFCWYTLGTNSVSKARAFYGELLGWTLKEVDLGGGQTQNVFHSGDRQVAGLNRIPSGTPQAPNWMSAIAVPDLAETHKRALQLGAKPIVPPTNIGTFGRLAVIMDPTGAPISLFQALGG